MVKKITIIGGSGFVGTNLSRKLALKQQDFEIIDIRESNQFPEKCKIADVRDIQSLRRAITGDVVINLAAVHRDDVRDKSEYKKTNVDGAENIAVVCQEKGIDKIIFTSTVAVYGFAAPGTDEEGLIMPFNDYGQTKFDAEEKFRLWQISGENSLIIVRPTVIFGEGNRGNVFNLLNQIASGKFLMVGKGQNKKSIAYIGNIVAFLEACISSKETYAVYNYVDTPDFTMDELVKRVRSTLRGKNNVGLRIPHWLGIVLGNVADIINIVTNINLPVSSIRVKKFTSSSEFVSSKHKLNNFQPPYTIDTALKNTLESEFINPDPDSEIFYTE